MIWLKSLASVRWFPYALIGVVSIVIAAFGYGYLKGYGTAEVKHYQAMTKTIKENHSRQIAAVQNQARREHEAHTIKSIPRPDTANCDAGGQWLHSIEDAVRTANHAAGTD